MHARPHSAGGLVPHAPESADGLALRAPESADGLAPRAPESAGGLAPQVDSGTRPIDEQLAARGLSPKLSPVGLPEFVAFSELLNATFPAGQQPTESAIVGLAFAAVLGRGIRGAEGVRWLRGVVGPSRWCELHGLISLKRLGRELLAEYRAIAQQKGWSWGSLKEGRHAGYSGGWFLRALAMNSRGALAAARKLKPILALIVEMQGGDLVPSVFLDLFGAFCGVPLRPRAKAVGYTGLDFGRMVWLWAASRGFVNPLQKLEPCVFAHILACQRPHSRRSHVAGGVVCSETFEAKRATLQIAVASQVAGGVAPPVLWPNVSMHLCEMSQLRRCFKPFVLLDVVQAPPERYSGAVEAMKQKLAQGFTWRGQCHTRLLVGSAVRALRIDQTVELGEMSAGTQKSTPWRCNGCGKWGRRDHRFRHLMRCAHLKCVERVPRGIVAAGGVALPAQAGGVAPPAQGTEKPSLCTHCDAFVFKLSRHWNSAACLRRRATASASAPMWKYERAPCPECGAAVAKCQLARHMASRRCGSATTLFAAAEAPQPEARRATCAQCGKVVAKSQLSRHQKSAACRGEPQQRSGAVATCVMCGTVVAKNQISRHRKSCKGAAREVVGGGGGGLAARAAGGLAPQGQVA